MILLFIIVHLKWLSMNLRNSTFNYVFSFFCSRRPEDFCNLTPGTSDYDFVIHNCAFEVAFDEFTQLYIQLCLFLTQVELCLRAYTSKNTSPAVASHQKRLWGCNGYAQICNKVNLPKNNTEGCQVTNLSRCIIIFTPEFQGRSQNQCNVYYLRSVRSSRIYENFILS